MAQTMNGIYDNMKSLNKCISEFNLFQTGPKIGDEFLNLD